MCKHKARLFIAYLVVCLKGYVFVHVERFTKHTLFVYILEVSQHVIENQSALLFLAKICIYTQVDVYICYLTYCFFCEHKTVYVLYQKYEITYLVSYVDARSRLVVKVTTNYTQF